MTIPRYLRQRENDSPAHENSLASVSDSDTSDQKECALKSDGGTPPIYGQKMTFRFGRDDEYWGRQEENQCQSMLEIHIEKSTPWRLAGKCRKDNEKTQTGGHQAPRSTLT